MRIAADEAFLRIWHGPIAIQSEGCALAQVRSCLALLQAASEAHLFGASQLELADHAQSEGTIHCIGSNVPGVVWLILANMLSAQGVGPARIVLAGADVGALIDVKPRWYGVALPQAQMPSDLSELLDIMDEFFVQFEFVRALSGEQREAFCKGTDAWAALVDAGAFPREDLLDSPSVIAAYTGRFEDPTTAMIDAEGMAASPNCFGLLIHLANYWHRVIGMAEITLGANRLTAANELS